MVTPVALATPPTPLFGDDSIRAPSSAPIDRNVTVTGAPSVVVVLEVVELVVVMLDVVELVVLDVVVVEVVELVVEVVVGTVVLVVVGKYVTSSAGQRLEFMLLPEAKAIRSVTPFALVGIANAKRTCVRPT